MPAARLTDRQKVELVGRFRAGEATQALADAFACSPNTVSRVVKAAVDPGEYERLRDQRSRRGGAVALPPTPVEAEEPVAQDQDRDSPVGLADPDPDPSPSGDLASEEAGTPGVLAIDDADDFGDDDDDLLDDDADEAALFVPVPLLVMGDQQEEVRPRQLEVADLPASAYMLVDKTVELQPCVLSECSELGRLPQEELERRALVVFVNPRQAKRLCGRTQRVIKIPDPAVLSRTAPYLLAQGISRVVIEGALFALPGS